MDTHDDRTGRPPRVHVLFVAANPRDTTRAALGAEMAAIKDGLRGAPWVDRITLHYEHDASASDLSRALQEALPAVVHFSGHGSVDGELLLTGDGGAAQPAAPEHVAALFEALSRDLRVRVVVLNACYTQRLAEALRPWVDCVLGVPDALRDDTAVVFAAAFYRALAFGRDVEAAHRLACSEARLAASGEVALPTLHCRDGVEASSVRLLPLRHPRESVLPPPPPPPPPPFGQRQRVAVVAALVLATAMVGVVIARSGGGRDVDDASTSVRDDASMRGADADDAVDVVDATADVDAVDAADVVDAADARDVRDARRVVPTGIARPPRCRDALDPRCHGL